MAIDGSKFKAVNNRDKNFTPHKLKAHQQQLDQSIARRYLADLDRADRDPSLVPEDRAELKEKLAAVRSRMKKLEATGRQLEATPDQQISLTDPDARSMATSGRRTGMVGYNVQAAVGTPVVRDKREQWPLPESCRCVLERPLLADTVGPSTFLEAALRCRMLAPSVV